MDLILPDDRSRTCYVKYTTNNALRNIFVL